VGRRWRRLGQAVARARAVGGAAGGMRHNPHDPEERGTSFYWFALTLARFVLYLGRGRKTRDPHAGRMYRLRGRWR
jgi:hypothetical protein